jgi:opacity protein-like surface antigen
MKRLIASIMVFSAAAAAADFKDVNRTVPLSITGLVTLESHKGAIQVTTWDRAEVEIKARVEAEANSSMDRRRFDGTDVSIDASADSVHIKTQYPDFKWCCSFEDDGSNPEVRYTIRMPRTARLMIRDHRSDTQISDLQGALSLQTHRGVARVHNLAGPLDLATHRGDVTVDFASFTGESKVTTHRGTINLAIPKNSRFDIETDYGRHASVETDFSMITRLAGGRSGKVHGSVNGGGPALRIDTFRGDVRIHAK